MGTLADELRAALPGAIIEVSEDSSYATSYEIQIWEQPLDAPRTGPIYRLVLRVSWLAPVAMTFAVRFDPGLAGSYLAEPESEQVRDWLGQVDDFLERHDIKRLDEDELVEIAPNLDVVLLDGASHDVMHLLFAEYLSRVIGGVPPNAPT